MNLVIFSLRRPWTIIVLVTALILGAGMALRQMKRDIFPPLGVPTIYVAQPYGGMDAGQMEGWLTYYYEYHFLYITGIEHVESKSIQGASLMKLQFHPGTDMNQAMSETVGYVNRARAFMPPGTVPPFVMRFDAGSVPVGYLVFSTDNPARTVGQMQDAALNQVRPLFATLPGVSAPPPFGGSARSILINVKPDRLRAYNISPDEVVQAITAANTISPSGNLALADSYPIVPSNAVVKNIQDLASVPLRVTPQGSVFVRDIGDITDGSDVVTSIAMVNGKRTVYIPVTKRSDASTLEVVRLVKENLGKFKAAVADDIKVTFEFDQSPVVNSAIHDLVREGLLGAVLTGLMVLLFLRDFRSAFIVVINIPLALMAALLALWIGGYSINLMTLGGLALAVGILVDEATVTMENIHAHRSRGVPLARAALDATSETTLPRLLAMLCVIAVFIPSFFMVGAARALFVPLALAVGFSMMASYFLSSTLVPVLCVWWLGKRVVPHDEPKSSFLQKLYRPLAKAAVAMRWILVPSVIAGCAGMTASLYPFLGSEIFPASDAAQLQLRFRGAAGTRLEKTEKLAQEILEIIKREAGADNASLTMGLIGVHAPNYPVNLIHLWNSGPEEGVLSVQLKAGSIAVNAFREKVRGLLKKQFPDVSFSFEPSDITSRVMSFGSATPIEVVVSGKELTVSRQHAEKIKTELEKVSVLRDVQFSQSLDYPSLNVQINRERAGLLGIKTSDAARSLVTATASSRFTVPNYWADAATGVSYNLQVQIPQTQMKDVEELRNLPIASSNGKPSLLRNIATISPGTTLAQYDRYNMVRMVSITANVQGSDLGTAAKLVQEAVAKAGALPPKTSVDIRGQIVPMKQLFDGLSLGLIVAIVAIFLLLTANFQSVRLALAVLSTIPAVFTGVVLILWLTHTTLNIQSFMGAIMAVGVAVANAILLVTFAHRSHRDGATRNEAAVTGAVSRLRPILMTSMAMMAGMLPMALGIGEGGGQTAPLARAVLGGLLFATAATLFLLPASFALLVTKKAKSASLDPDDTESSHSIASN